MIDNLVDDDVNSSLVDKEMTNKNLHMDNRSFYKPDLRCNLRKTKHFFTQ